MNLSIQSKFAHNLHTLFMFSINFILLIRKFCKWMIILVPNCFTSQLTYKVYFGGNYWIIYEYTFPHSTKSAMEKLSVENISQPLCWHLLQQNHVIWGVQSLERSVCLKTNERISVIRNVTNNCQCSYSRKPISEYLNTTIIYREGLIINHIAVSPTCKDTIPFPHHKGLNFTYFRLNMNTALFCLKTVLLLSV